MYRRRPGFGLTHKGKTFTNSDVVPYDAFLLFKYRCHLNVEVCSSMSSIKYLYKYFYKGVDMAMLQARVPRGLQDEVEKFQCMRYTFIYLYEKTFKTSFLDTWKNIFV